MNESVAPPPLERFSAEKFRQWLAGMVSQEPPSTKTDSDEVKESLVAFLAACPLVYGLKDRMTMWTKIGDASFAALETCDGELSTWANEVLTQIDAAGGSVASCTPVVDALAGFEAMPDWKQAEAMRLLRKLRLVLPTLARARWEQAKEKSQAKKGGDDGGE